MSVDLPDTDERTWSDDHGSLRFMKILPRVGYVIAEGRASDGAAEAWEQNFSWLVVDDASIFFDAEKLTMSGSRFTSISSSTTIKHRDQYAEYHVLVGNVVIAMLAKTINLSLGNFMTIHRKRDEFELELGRALEEQKS